MNGLLVRKAEKGRKNIGDYIQSAAQEQYWDHIDLILDREHLDAVTSPSGESIHLIMNSWWMWNLESFPPAKVIHPLFVSFHISPHIAERMLTPESIKYLKSYEPIGARDTGTMKILKNNHIKSYFSGCLTLTLDQKYKSADHSGPVYFVDPEYPLFRPRAYKDYFLALLLYLRHFKKISVFSKKFIFERRTVFARFSKKLNKKICAVWFVHQYKQFFTEEIIYNADYITHMVDAEKEYPTNEACLTYARELIHLYSHASMIITSRIHAALPSLGLGTPVFFVDSPKIDAGVIEGRLGGLIDLFNYRFIANLNGLFPQTDELKALLSVGKVSPTTILQNSNKYLQYHDSLIYTVKEFVKNCK